MAKVHFITQGCSANVADSEVMQGLVKEEHSLVDSPEEADIVVFNTCTVKGPTENEFKRKITELKKLNKKVVLAGCIPQGQPKDFSEYSRVGTYQIKQIKKAVDSTLHGDVVSYLERVDEGRLNTPKVRKNSLVEIVPILQGCLNSCTFCKTKHARGNANSYPVLDIVRHISKAAEEGVKEIWLTSQDNAVYGLEFDSNLALLLKSIITIDRDFKIRVGMGNPKYMLLYLDELINVMKNPKVFKFIHIPLQAGSDKVLTDMKRGYTASEFSFIVKRFREAIPDISIATDIICGFPTETAEDFTETIRVLKETKCDMINVSRFWPRPGTPAASLKQVDGAEAKERCKKLMDLFHSIAAEHNKQFIGKTEKILITEAGKDGSFIGKNDCYKQVILKGDFKIGQEVNVKIVDATSLDLRGEII
jgi:threonylcarbamoyladenosine tRNA methylthiotransferase CDKAL1